MARVLLLLGALLLAGASPTEAAIWKLTRDAEGLKIWQRPFPNSGINQIRAEYSLEAPAKRVWEVFRDVEAFPEIFPHIAESRILHEEGDERLVYQRLQAPLPVLLSDRDLTFRAHARADFATNVFQQDLSLANEQGPPEKTGVIRVRVFSASWILEPQGPNRTRVVYWFHADPGGWIPDWLVNFAQGRGATRTIKAIENRAKDPSWHH